MRSVARSSPRFSAMEGAAAPVRRTSVLLRRLRRVRGTIARLVSQPGPSRQSHQAADLGNDTLGRDPFIRADEEADGLPRERSDAQDDAPAAVSGLFEMDVPQCSMRPRSDTASRPEVGTLSNHRDALRGDDEDRADARHLVEDHLVGAIHLENRRTRLLAWS
jgi:hypothetical protein